MTREIERVTCEASVASNRRMGDAGTMIELAVPRSFPEPRAGQFVQIRCLPEIPFRLPRPFSICRWRRTPTGGELGILFSVVGEGSRWLAARKRGDAVTLVGPLGVPYRPIPGRLPCLIGGGRGVAPMLLLADQIAADFPDGILLYGARDEAALFPTEVSPYPVYRSTLDGSIGTHGTVLDMLEGMMRRGGIRPEHTALYGCGPTGMLEAVARFAQEAGMPAQVSLETVFGCGTGICAGCAVPIALREGESEDAFRRYAFACTDGPVFDASRVDWSGVHE